MKRAWLGRESRRDVIRQGSTQLVDEPTINACTKKRDGRVRIDPDLRGACSLRPGSRGSEKHPGAIGVVRFLENHRYLYYERRGQTNRSIWPAPTGWGDNLSVA